MSWIMVGGAAVGGIAANAKHDQAVKQEDSDRKLAATTQQYSPWTHLQAGPIRTAGNATADIAQGAVGGAMTGAALGQGFNKLNATPATAEGNFVNGVGPNPSVPRQNFNFNAGVGRTS